MSCTLCRAGRTAVNTLQRAQSRAIEWPQPKTGFQNMNTDEVRVRVGAGALIVWAIRFNKTNTSINKAMVSCVYTVCDLQVFHEVSTTTHKQQLVCRPPDFLPDLTLSMMHSQTY